MMREMARGAAWMVGFRIAERGLGFISILILARLLLPADFGLVAMAMSVVALIELAGAFGFDHQTQSGAYAARRRSSSCCCGSFTPSSIGAGMSCQWPG